jgi:integrase
MALNLYRRHRLQCEAGHPEESSSGEFQERSKKWKRCGCQIFASGVLGGKFRRRRTGKHTWEEAKAVVKAWETAGRWDGAAEISTALPSKPPKGATIEQATKAFLEEHKGSAINTQRKYGFIMDKLKTYSAHKGYTRIEQWGPVDVREFRDSWKIAVQTANRDMSIVRSFFELCLCNEWIDRNPGKLVKNVKNRSGADNRNEQKLPFTDAELEKMYYICEHRYGKMEIKWDRTVHHRAASGLMANYKYRWSGRDLADFVSVSLYTGMRISDIATFHIDRLKPTGEVHIRTTKTGTHVNTWVPEWLQQVIRRRSLEIGPLIFGEHETKDHNVITDIWRRKLKRLWRLCGDWKEKPTPHRFRHTFARILLERPGVEVRDVAELLGNSEQMVRKHYSAWIAERQDRLTAVLKEAFQEKPRPGVVVEMPKAGTK